MLNVDVNVDFKFPDKICLFIDVNKINMNLHLMKFVCAIFSCIQ